MADNTRMKTMDAEVKKLYKLMEEIVETHQNEIARINEANQCRFDAVQQSLTQVVQLHQSNHASSSLMSTPMVRTCTLPLTINIKPCSPIDA